MLHTNFSLIYDYIKNRLEKVPKPLPNDKIENEINEVKSLFDLLPQKQMTMLIGHDLIDELHTLSEHEWDMLKNKLQTLFSVEQNRGIAIRGDESQKRLDPEWWTLNVKEDGKTYLWSRYKRFMEESLPFKVVKTMDDDTDIVMNLLENPKTNNEFSTYGMVVGHVQSGKTANYSALISKAADAGYKFIVVIAGGLNNLRDQTQERLNYSFIGRDDGKYSGVGNYADTDKAKLPISLTTKYADFNKSDANKEFDLDMGNRPVILVIKKNTHTLTNVISWLKSHYKNGIRDHSMLLIDDESDYASVNTKDENNPTSINKKIRELLNMFRKSAYVAYTATPYANIFIDYKAENEKYGEDLFPKDFIYALAAPTNYFGAQRIFLDEDKKHFVEVSDHEDFLPLNHKKDLELNSLPPSLEEAIRLFVLNVAIRHLRRQEDKHNSMMIHVTRFTDVHKEVYLEVSQYLEKNLKKHIEIHGKMPNALENKYVSLLKETFDKHHFQLEFKWEEVLSKLTDVINTIHTKEVHQKSTSGKLIYPEDKAVNYIVVGGMSLARGYTLEGLSVSYFLRNTIFYDTLMQMGRWFGYRPDYEDLCKIYTTDEIFERFKTIIIATDDLIDSLEKMRSLNMTPRDFGLAVQQHPDSGLQVTARNKQKETTDIQFEMKLDGHLKETSWISSNENDIQHNINVIEETVELLNKKYYTPRRKKLWENVESEDILKVFKDFKFFGEEEDEFGIHSRMPVKFVREYIDTIDTNWDVVIHSGQSKNIMHIDSKDYGGYQKRTVIKRDGRYEFGNRQVSSGNAEEISLTEEQIEILNIKELEKKKQNKDKKLGKRDSVDAILAEFSRRKSTREMLARPLLMLHLIEVEIVEKVNGVLIKETDQPKIVAALSVSFPSNINSGNRNIRLRVNKVYLHNLEREMAGLEDEDDVED